MKGIELNDKKIIIKGKEEFLICGEIHYFRINPLYWEDVLDRLIEVGCNAVAFYIPWFIHEPEEGVFDFEGKFNKNYNLIGWMELVKKKNLLAFVRPGPYIYAEMTNLGIPLWYFENYPESVVKCYKDGKLQKIEEDAAPHNNPNFLKCVKRWYEKVCEIIRIYQEPEGPIIMVQACNEIPGLDCDDQNPETLGIGKKDGLFPIYLKNKYETIENFNKKYGLNFLRFEDIQPKDLLANKNMADNEHLEFYYTYYYPEYFRKLVTILKENGITVPIVHNAYNPRAVSLHYHTKRKIPDLFIGVDCYYSMQGNLNAKSLSYYCEFGAEILKSMVRCVPFAVEEECGYWNDDPPVYGPELYDFLLWTFASGYKGINLYLFSGGKNENRMGYYGTYHGWQAPVDDKGQERENYVFIKNALKVVKENKDVFNGEKIYDISLGIYNEPGMIWKNVSRSCVETNYMMFMNNISCNIVDIENTSLNELEKQKLIWVVSDGEMPNEIQEKLLSYANKGGNLVVQGLIPEDDINFNPATLMIDTLKIEIAHDKKLNEKQTKIVINNEEIYVGKYIQSLSFDGDVLAKDIENNPVIIRKRFGEGNIIIVPFEFEYKFLSQLKIINTVLEACNIRPNVRSNKIRCILKKAREKEYVIAMNYHPVYVKEKITIYDKGIHLDMEPYEIKIFKV